MSHYIHGSDPKEQQRLSLLNELVNNRCINKISLKSGMRVLDVGSGLGQFTALLAQQIGNNGFCLGIERDEKQLIKAKAFSQSNLEFRIGDALDIPFLKEEKNSFDLVHSRFLLEHLPDPSRAVKQMAKALRFGGKIIVADDDHQTLTLFPEPEGFQSLWSAYMDSFLEVGNDPYIGRKLPKLLIENGFINVKNDVVFFGDCAGTSTFPGFVSNLVEVIGTAKQIMVTHQLINDTECDKAIDQIFTWSKIPYASIWYTICFAEGTLPGRHVIGEKADFGDH